MTRLVTTQWVDETKKPVYSGPADKAHEILPPGSYETNPPGHVLFVGEYRSFVVRESLAITAVWGSIAVSAAGLVWGTARLIKHSRR